MPLLDHFRPLESDVTLLVGLYDEFRAQLTAQLQGRLPADFTAIDTASLGRPTFVEPSSISTLWTTPSITTEFSWFDVPEVQVEFTEYGRQLLTSSILLAPPSVQAESARSRHFIATVANRLLNGVCTVLIDLQTDGPFNLHDEIVDLMRWSAMSAARSPGQAYAVTYRPTLRNHKGGIDVWYQTFKIGEALPTMPFRLTGELFVQLDLESAYVEACRRRRITG